MESIKKEIGINMKSKKIFTTYGGKTRMESILQIIKKFQELYKIENDDILCLSDANRPLISDKIYSSVIKEASINLISCPSKNLVDGIACVENGFIKDIPEKTKFHTIQTPEACNLKKLIDLIELEKHKNKSGLSEIFLGAGIHPKVVESDHTTYKVTYPGDYEIIEALMKKK